MVRDKQKLEEKGRIKKGGHWSIIAMGKQGHCSLWDLFQGGIDWWIPSQRRDKNSFVMYVEEGNTCQNVSCASVLDFV